MSLFMVGDKRNSGGRVYPLPSSIKWGEWERCLMIHRRKSITGKQICGFGWMRKEGIWESPDRPGYYAGSKQQFAKDKKEIFLHKLKEEQ